MSKFSSASFAVLAIFLASPAIAADATEKGSTLGLPALPALSDKGDFSGPYVGIGAGGEFANIELGDYFDGIGADGLVGEAVLGYDFRFGGLVIGPRIVGGIANVNTQIGDNDLINLDGYINFGGRAGVVFNRTLVYAQGGYEMMFASSDSPFFDEALEEADLNAWTMGIGLETAIANNVSLAAEGTYVSGIDDAEGLEAFRGVVRLNIRR